MTGEQKHNSESRVWNLARALRSRNYRLFVAGQGLSVIGTWMQQVAINWLVYRLTGSAMLLGVVNFASHIPSFLLSPVAGVMADRCDRRRLLLATQTLSLLQAGVLAVIVLAGVEQVWQIILLSLLLGIVNGFDIPLRHAFVVQMVDDREDMSNAIALNSSMFNVARLIGPSIAGLLVACVGEGVCFVINSASYLAAIAALAAMRITPPESPPQRTHVFRELREGFDYSFGFRPIRSILFLVALISLLGMPYAVLIPVFAREVHHGGAHTYGFLMAASGAGALAGTLFLASRRSVLGLGRLIVCSAVLFGCGIAVFALTGSLSIALPALFMAGFGSMTLYTSCNTIIQTIVEEDKRGRVMSFYTMALIGATPLGSLIAGSLAGSLGAWKTVLLCGLSCLTGAVFFARELPGIREKVRPIYLRMGIIREVAKGMEASPTQ